MLPRRFFYSLCVILWALHVAFGDGPLPSANLTSEQRTALQAEIDRLAEETQSLDKQGKLKEAVAAGEKVLAAERRLLGNQNQEIANDLMFLAPRYERLEDFEAAKRAREECLKIVSLLKPKDDPLVTDCRCALEYTITISKLSGEQRAELEGGHAVLAQVAGLYAKGKYAEALPLVDEVRQIREGLLGKRHRDVASAIGWQAFFHRLLGNYAEAEELQVQQIDIDREAIGEAHPVFANDLNNLATIYHARGKKKEAVALYRQSLELTKKIHGEASPVYAGGLLNLATIVMDQGDLAQAEPLLIQASEILRAAGGESHPDYPRVLNSLASLYQEQGRYELALPLFSQAVELRKKHVGEEHPLYANSLHNLAALHVIQGYYTKAEPLYQQVLQIRRKAFGEKHPLYAATLNQLGELFHALEDYAQAELVLKQALEIQLNTVGESHPDYARTLNNLATVHFDQGNFSSAAKLYQQALEVLRTALGESHPQFARGLANLGVLHSRQGDFARAEVLFRQSIEVAKTTLGEEHPDYGKKLIDLANCYQSLRDYDRAQPLYERGSAILLGALGAKHPRYATSLNNRALNHAYRREYAEAERLFREVMQIQRELIGEKHPGYATALHNLGFIHSQQDEYMEAEPYYQLSFDIRKEALGEAHPDTARTLGELAGVLHSQKKYTEAEREYRKVLEIYRKNLELAADGQSERQQLAMLANVRYRLDEFIRLGVDSPEHRKHQWREVLAWKGVVLTRQRALRALGDSPELKALGTELQVTAARLAAFSFATPTPEKLPAWREQIAELTARKESLEQQLAAANSGYRKALQPVTPEDVQKSFPPQTVLLDFVQYAGNSDTESQAASGLQTRLAVFVVRATDEVQMVDLGSMQTIRDAIEKWRTGLGNSPESRQAASVLRESLWNPIEKYLEDVTTVLISPDGELGKLPFAALPGSNPGTYLLEQYALVLVPAPQTMVGDSENETSSSRRLLAIGGVEYDRRAETAAVQTSSESRREKRAARDQSDRAFSSLPGTASELTVIQKLHAEQFGSDQQTILQGTAATQDAILAMATGSRYVHLATHGYFAAPRYQSALDRSVAAELRGSEAFASSQSLVGYHPGLLSGIALAGANQPTEADDGILTAIEVSTLNLQSCDLVVLSACETGLGKSAAGDGLIGLQRAFQVAGAKSLVTSLWSVDDRATETLMKEFYRNLWEKKLGKLEALRQAQLTMLAEYDPSKQRLVRGFTFVDEDGDDPKLARLPPYYWAAFVLSGDWR